MLQNVDFFEETTCRMGFCIRLDYKLQGKIQSELVFASCNIAALTLQKTKQNQVSCTNSHSKSNNGTFYVLFYEVCFKR